MSSVEYLKSFAKIWEIGNLINMKHMLQQLLGRVLCRKEEAKSSKQELEFTSQQKYAPFPDIMIPEPKVRFIWTYIVFLVFSIVTSLSYLSWRVLNIIQMVSNMYLLDWWEIGGAFLRFGGEIILTCLAYIQTVYIVLLLWRKKTHSEESFDFEGVREEKFNKDTEVTEKIDIIIPCCKEPLQMIKDTVSAVIAIDWNDIDIFVCDDGADDDLKEWIDHLQKEILKNLPTPLKRSITYVRRLKEDPHHAKAGNINNCFKSYCSSKYVAVIDADMIIHPSFLRRSIPMFGGNVAYVQTPQTYYNIGSKDPWASDAQKRFYYNVQHIALHRWGASECVGTGVIFRHKHLASIGGFTYGSLTEDTATGLELHKAGYSSCYLPQVLQLGTTPPSLAGQYRQKMRWTLGGLQTFHKSRILFDGSLRGFVQKWPYLSIGIHFYSVILVYIPTVLLACISFVTDNYFIYFTSVDEVLHFYHFYIPYLLFLSIMTRLQYTLFLEGGHVLYHRACSWFLFSLVMPVESLYRNFVKPGLLQFKVTNAKDTIARNTNFNNIKKLIPFALYFLFFFLSIVKTLVSMALETKETITWEDWLFLLGKLFWAGIMIQYTFPILLGVLQDREYPDHQDLVRREMDKKWGIELPFVKQVRNEGDIMVIH